MSTLEQWTASVCADLGLDPGAADTRAVLDLARDVAHAVARPAAPLTAYLVGMAVGRGLALPDAAARVQALAAGWSPEPSQSKADLSERAVAGPVRPAGLEQRGAPGKLSARLPDSYRPLHRQAVGPGLP
jgi:Domain of unknown function (DUF6457)